MFRREKLPGIALGITMMLMVVLTVIVSGFFQAYRSHFSLTRSSNSSEAAINACESIFEYVSFRLEHDRTWGSKPFESEALGKDPISPLITFQSEAGSHSFSGKIDSLNATFEGVIYNNISGTSVLPVSTAPETALCRVTCKSGESTKRVEFLLKVAPLFDSSVLSRAEIRIDSNQLILRSSDGNRNFIRAEENIYVPDMLNGARTKFLTTDDAPDNNGMLWTKKDIYTYLGTTEHKLEGADFSIASANSHGKMVAGAESHFSLLELDEEQLQIPETHNVVTHAELPGRWNFVRRPALLSYRANYLDDDEFSHADGSVEVWVDVLEHYADPESTVPTHIYRGGNRTEDILEHVSNADHDDVEGDLVSIDTTGLSVHGYSDDNITIVPNGLKTFGDVAGTNLTFNLGDQSVTASHDAIVKVNGPFHLTSTTHDGAPTPTPPPVLNLGYTADGSIAGGVSKAAIVAEGKISIKDGVTEGLGTLVSRKGNVEIQPKNTKTLTIDPHLAGAGLLVFAGNDVVLRNPNSTENWDFKGLVYARGKVQMRGSKAENLKFEGSVVALNHPSTIDSDPKDPFRGIDFADCGNVEFIYNSKMLDAYVRAMRGERIRVETAFWKD